MAPRLLVTGRYSKIFFQMVMCITCGRVITEPTTGDCGHTRCSDCVATYPCKCGFTSSTPLSINTHLDDILTKLYTLVKVRNFSMKTGFINIPRAPNGAVRHRISKKGVVTASRPMRLLVLNVERPNLNSVSHWLQISDVECTICTNPFSRPITTPCGHMFCKLCIERQWYYMDSCPLCKAPLQNFNLHEVRVTRHMELLLKYLGLFMPRPVTTYFVPLLNVGPVFPEVVCSLTFSRGSREFIYKLINSARPVIGMVQRLPGNQNEYGTVLAIKDCVQMHDGTLNITGLGLRRFKILERHKMTGFELGRVVNLYDTDVPDYEYEYLLYLGRRVLDTARWWFDTIETHPAVRRELLSYGSSSLFDVDIGDSFNRNGPTWLWRLISILPLKKYLLSLLLCERSVKKRLIVVEQVIKMAISNL